MDGRSPSPRPLPRRAAGPRPALLAVLAALAVVPCAPASPAAAPSSRAKGKVAAVAKPPASRPARGKAPGRSRKSSRPAKPPAPPPPDPLAGAWPSRESPQVGDGTLPSEVLVAARRLVGLQGSFDEDTFLRHLAYVTDLARKSDRPDDAWTEHLARQASARKALRRDARARPGDLALFSLDAARPRSSGSRRVLAGVVESVDGGTVRFIAPVGDEVRRGEARPGKKPSTRDTVLGPCRAPDPPRGKGGRGGKKGKARTRGKALPCHAGALWIGWVPADALPQLF